MGESPVGDNEKDRVIFIGTLTKDKKVQVDVKCPSFPILAYAYKLLGLHIDNMIIKAQMEQKPKMIKLGQGSLDSLRKFLN